MTRMHYDWPAIIAELAQRPGEWRCLYRDHSARLAASIRLRRHPALRFEGGRLEATVVNVYTPAEGGRRGDIWVRYTTDLITGEEQHGTANQGETETERVDRLPPLGDSAAAGG